jgi:hypothetical protein
MIPDATSDPRRGRSHLNPILAIGLIDRNRHATLVADRRRDSTRSIGPNQNVNDGNDTSLGLVPVGGPAMDSRCSCFDPSVPAPVSHRRRYLRSRCPRRPEGTPCRRYPPVRSRCLHPGQQQGRRWPSSSSSWVRRMRRSRVVSCLASSTQQMNSLRARGVMSVQASSAVGLAIRALRRSPGSLCTTPPGTRLLLTVVTVADQGVDAGRDLYPNGAAEHGGSGRAILRRCCSSPMPCRGSAITPVVPRSFDARVVEVRVLLDRMDAVYDVGGKGRSGDLHRLRRQVGDVVEEPLAPAEEDWDDVEH